MSNSSSPEPRRGVPLWAQIVVWGLLVGLLALLAMGMTRAQPRPVQTSEKIPIFALTLYSGYEYNGQSEVALSDFAGKIVLINFWASWCKPCEQEAAELQQAWEYYQPTGQVIFLGVDYVDTEPEARAYLKRFAITYPNGPDLGTQISQLFRISGVPETYILDQDGILRYIKVGPFSSLNEIQAVIDPMLP